MALQTFHALSTEEPEIQWWAGFLTGEYCQGFLIVQVGKSRRRDSRSERSPEYAAGRSASDQIEKPPDRLFGLLLDYLQEPRTKGSSYASAI